jgi:hypothetical protein
MRTTVFASFGVSAIASTIVACGGQSEPSFIAARQPSVGVARDRPRPGTVFISSSGEGSGTASIVRAAPPYRTWLSTNIYESLVPLGLAKSGTLFTASDLPGGELWSIAPPYRQLKTLDHDINSAISIALDTKDDVFLSQGRGDSGYVREYPAPKYKPGPWLGQVGRNIGPEGVTALASGQIAVASTTVKGSSGSIDIFTDHGGKFSDQKTAGITHPGEIVAEPGGPLVATWCSPCGSAEEERIGIIGAPYSKVTKTVATLSKTAVLGVAIDGRTIFTCDDYSTGVTMIVEYPYPYHSSQRITQTKGCYGAFGVSGSGGLIFARQDPVYFQVYDIYLLEPPYNGRAREITNVGGAVPESLVFAQ